MTVTSKIVEPRLRYERNAYQFVFQALRYTQQKLGREAAEDGGDESAHVSGRELLEGIRQFAIEQFGLMTLTVFRHWGVSSSVDFGRMVFELVEAGEMRKTDRDQIEDFFDLYDFEDAFDREYRLNTSKAFCG